MMTTDLEELFNDAGRTPPASTVNLDLAIRRGRRIRTRRRVLVGTSGLMGVGILAAGAVTVGPHLLSPAPSALGAGAGGQSGAVTANKGGPPVPTAVSKPVVDTSSKTQKYGPPPADLAAVSLPDPAPGFPYRRWTDEVSVTSLGADQTPQWVTTFGLGVRPEGTSNSAEITILVGHFALPALADGSIEGNPVIASPHVAGVVGHVTSYSEKGTPRSALYFSTGRFSVEVYGFEDVSTDQLVALGNALDGI